MESDTLRSRVEKLVQKSRKAVRLYAGMERMQGEAQAPYTEAQVREWREVNSELSKELAMALEFPSQRRVAGVIVHLKDRFLDALRSGEAQVAQQQRDLVRAAEHGDFVKSAILSADLIRAKARVQATQAAHHELEDILRQSKITVASEPSAQQAIELAEELPPRAKIIPIRRQV